MLSAFAGAVPEGAEVTLTCDSGSAYNPPARITWHHEWPRWASEARAVSAPRVNSSRVVPSIPYTRANSSLSTRAAGAGGGRSVNGAVNAAARNGQKTAETAVATIASFGGSDVVGSFSFGALKTVSTLALGRVGRSDNGAAFRCSVSQSPIAPTPIDVPFALTVACMPAIVAYNVIFSLYSLTSTFQYLLYPYANVEV